MSDISGLHIKVTQCRFKVGLGETIKQISAQNHIKGNTLDCLILAIAGQFKVMFVVIKPASLGPNMCFL